MVSTFVMMTIPVILADDDNDEIKTERNSESAAYPPAQDVSRRLRDQDKDPRGLKKAEDLSVRTQIFGTRIYREDMEEIVAKVRQKAWHEADGGLGQISPDGRLPVLPINRDSLRPLVPQVEYAQDEDNNKDSGSLAHERHRLNNNDDLGISRSVLGPKYQTPWEKIKNYGYGGKAGSHGHGHGHKKSQVPPAILIIVFIFSIMIILMLCELKNV